MSVLYVWWVMRMREESWGREEISTCTCIIFYRVPCCIYLIILYLLTRWKVTIWHSVYSVYFVGQRWTWEWESVIKKRCTGRMIKKRDVCTVLYTVSSIVHTIPQAHPQSRAHLPLFHSRPFPSSHFYFHSSFARRQFRL
jgi:hypothetical protein